jgi:transcriptional regulator GlxA family with amidase domain
VVKLWKIGILLFNEDQVLDFAGPFQVFSITNCPESNFKPFEAKTVAQSREIVRARNGIHVVPDCCFADNSKFDILIVPGGYGAEEIEINNVLVIDWLKEQMSKVVLMASVCTGAFLLAKAGLLDGKNRQLIGWTLIGLREFEKVNVERGVKYVDEGSIITAGGVSAVINMSIYIVTKLLGEKVGLNTAKRMEYDFNN